MAYKINEIEGIGAVMQEKLAASDITTTEQLLEQCGGKKGRAEVAKATGCTEKQLLKWANMADLMRISGIGKQYSELLEAAGVDTVKELRTRNAANLTAAMASTNEEKKLARTSPSESMVTGWIESAEQLDPAISH
jgi:predicted flap endonuclease-1-like 5' DNA nuclease